MAEPCTQKERIERLETAFESVALVHQAMFGTGNKDGVFYMLNENSAKLKTHDKIIYILSGFALASSGGVIESVLAKFI